MQELEKLKKILEKIKVPKELYKLSTYLFLRYSFGMDKRILHSISVLLSMSQYERHVL